MDRYRSRLRAVRAMFIAGLLLVGCAGPPSDITQLVLRDSTYLAPGTLKPFSGEVFKSFEDDPDQLQLRGRLKGGRWNGELTVYHPSGRVRYQGELVDGERCGAWLENQDQEPPGDVWAQLKEEIENLAIYPPCDSLR